MSMLSGVVELEGRSALSTRHPTAIMGVLGLHDGTSGLQPYLAVASAFDRWWVGLMALSTTHDDLPRSNCVKASQRPNE